MGGADLQNQMTDLYKKAFWSKKYHQRMIFHLIDMAIVNACLFCRRDATNLSIQKSKQLSLSNFKMQVAFSLIKTKKGTLKRKGRPSSSFVELEYEKEV